MTHRHLREKDNYWSYVLRIKVKCLSQAQNELHSKGRIILNELVLRKEIVKMNCDAINILRSHSVGCVSHIRYKVAN